MFIDCIIWSCIKLTVKIKYSKIHNEKKMSLNEKSHFNRIHDQRISNKQHFSKHTAPYNGMQRLKNVCSKIIKKSEMVRWKGWIIKK